MASDQFIAARVSSDTKARLRALAVKRGLSDSALLKDLLELTLGAGVPAQLEDADVLARPSRHARLYVRLPADDRLLLAERAAARRVAPATYVSVLIRAHLRDLAPLPADELRALNRAVAELGAVGRNLNQIARALHQAGSAAESRRVEFAAMMKICAALRDHVKELLKANAVSWRVGHETPRP
ncbi:MAG: plasmid mobilization relaxosome protein MobC [Steroidobacteraceae bacterium]